MGVLLNNLRKKIFLFLSVLIHLIIFVLAVLLNDISFFYKKPLKYIEITEIESQYNEEDNDAKRLAEKTNKAKKETVQDNNYKNYNKPSPKQDEKKFSKKSIEEELKKNKEFDTSRESNQELSEEDKTKEAKNDSPETRKSIFQPPLSNPNLKIEETVDLSTKEFKYISYFLKIKRKIQMVWSYPKDSYNRGEAGRVLVMMSLDSTGKLVDVSVLKSSGFERLDNEATSAIITAAPYPPFPQSWGTLKKLNIRVMFAYMPNSWNFR